jgi:hypothetical protein
MRAAAHVSQVTSNPTFLISSYNSRTNLMKLDLLGYRTIRWRAKLDH